jgi:hypothetical protein
MVVPKKAQFVRSDPTPSSRFTKPVEPVKRSMMIGGGILRVG